MSWTKNLKHILYSHFVLYKTGCSQSSAAHLDGEVKSVLLLRGTAGPWRVVALCTHFLASLELLESQQLDWKR